MPLSQDEEMLHSALQGCIRVLTQESNVHTQLTHSTHTSCRCPRHLFSAPVPGDSKDRAKGVTGRIPDEDEQSTGIERKELNKMLEGVEV